MTNKEFDFLINYTLDRLSLKTKFNLTPNGRSQFIGEVKKELENNSNIIWDDLGKCNVEDTILTDILREVYDRDDV